MSELLELALRVEALSGPDREVDVAIFAFLHPDCRIAEQRDLDRFPDDPFRFVEKNGLGRLLKVPTYTASLDAAMTLVPDDYDWIIGRTNGGLTIHAEVGSREQVFGNTPALALCAAALRARTISSEKDVGI